jgi:hypothetical protein
MSRTPPPPELVARLTRRRDGSRYTAATGVGMMFMAGWSWQIGVGGALMVLGGLASSAFWSARLRRIKGNPWDYDPEIDGPDPKKRRGLEEADKE